MHPDAEMRTISEKPLDLLRAIFYWARVTQGDFAVFPRFYSPNLQPYERFQHALEPAGKPAPENACGAQK